MSKPFITTPTIHIAPSVRRGFLRRAWKAYPNEYMEVLLGERDKKHVYVHLSVHASQKATPGWVQFTDDVEIEELHKEAKDKGLIVVGSWHTHPLSKKEGDLREVCAHLSFADHDEGARMKELVSPVSVLWVNQEGKRVSRTTWWVPQGRIRVEPE